MELKHIQKDLVVTDVTLLIVPYGIETTRSLLFTFRRLLLLIVPYGIETCKVTIST